VPIRDHDDIEDDVVKAKPRNQAPERRFARHAALAALLAWAFLSSGLMPAHAHEGAPESPTRCAICQVSHAHGLAVPTVPSVEVGDVVEQNVEPAPHPETPAVAPRSSVRSRAPPV
jgi:hypothetical protein